MRADRWAHLLTQVVLTSLPAPAISCQYHLRERVGRALDTRLPMDPPADAGGTDLTARVVYHRAIVPEV
jgi:hypothetical protein